MNLGNALKHFRHINNITQEELAKKTEVSVNFISRVERSNSQNISLETLDKLAKGLNIPIEDLLTYPASANKKIYKLDNPLLKGITINIDLNEFLEQNNHLAVYLKPYFKRTFRNYDLDSTKKELTTLLKDLKILKSNKEFPDFYPLTVEEKKEIFDKYKSKQLELDYLLSNKYTLNTDLLIKIITDIKNIFP